MTRLQNHQTKALTAHAKLVRQGLAKSEDFRMPARIVRDNTEWHTQASVFRWWRSYCRTVGIAPCLFFAVPNGVVFGGSGETRAKQGRMMKLTGLTAGVADCFLAVPKWGDVGSETNEHIAASGLFLELKAPSGLISDDQQIFRAAVVAQGYQHCVAYSAEEAINVITTYLTK